MLTKEEAIKIIIKNASKILMEKDKKVYSIDFSTPLYGKNGILDSLSLVRLIADIEEDYYNVTTKEIVLADEKAMSQSSSPFLTIETLAKYILQLQDNIQ